MSHRISRLPLVVLSLAVMAHSAIAHSAMAQSSAGPPDLAAYGALPAVELVQVSPSGDRIALVMTVDEARALAVIDLISGGRPTGAAVGRRKVRDLDWIRDERILITTSGTETNHSLGIDQTEFFTGQIFTVADRRVVNAISNIHEVLPALIGPPSVRTTDAGPAVYVRAVDAARGGDIDLFRVDPRTGRARRAESMGVQVSDFVLGADGRSVARALYDEKTRVWSLRLRRGDSFIETWSVNAPLDTPELMGLGINGQSVIIDALRPDLTPEGGFALYDVELTTGTWRRLRFPAKPDHLLFHPVTHRLIGAATVGDEALAYQFFDQAAADAWAVVEATFVGQSPELVSWSDDLRRVAVFVSGPEDSGSYHLLDLDAGTSLTIGQAYAGITPDQVAPVQAITYAAADGLEIHGYLTIPRGVSDPRGLPLVVLAHGGPQSRDRMGFDWWAQALASRGYVVLQPNFRGSTGYGQAFITAGYGEWGRKMQTDLSDGVRWLASRGIIDPARVCIVGASYGGYAAMAGPTLDTGVYLCAVSYSGVSDLRRMVNREAEEGARRDNETVRYWNRFMGAERLGDRSLDERSPARLADQADAPILLIHGRDDTVVPIEQSRVMAAALRRAGKPVEFVELPGEDHWLSRGETRTRMLTETIRFLQTHNPAD